MAELKEKGDLLMTLFYQSETDAFSIEVVRKAFEVCGLGKSVRTP